MATFWTSGGICAHLMHGMSSTAPAGPIMVLQHLCAHGLRRGFRLINKRCPIEVGAPAQQDEDSAVVRTMPRRLRTAIAPWSVGSGVLALPNYTGEPRRQREEHARGVPWLSGWHKTSVVSPEICDTLTPGNSRVALPLCGGVLCHTGREVSDHVATDDQHAMVRKMTATQVCAAACLDSTIRVEAMGGQSTQVSQRGRTGRPGQTDSAAHTRWARQAQPSVRQPAVRPPGPPPTGVSRLHALLRYNAVPQGADHPYAGVPCPAPLPRVCTATHW